MSDTEILDGMEKHAIQAWPNETKIYKDAPKRVSTWTASGRDPKLPGMPMQATRLSLRAALVEVIQQLDKP